MSLDKLPGLLMNADWLGAEELLAPMAASPTAAPSLLYNYAKVLFELDRFEPSVAMFRRVVETAPEHADAWFELGRAALRIEDLALAFDAFEMALALDPGDTDAQRNLGRLALRLGRYEIAREAWAPFAGDAEADLALYRVAAETGARDAAERRARLLAEHPDRARLIQTLVRTAKGAIPLDLRRPK